jgi:hypothetical protein
MYSQQIPNVCSRKTEDIEKVAFLVKSEAER